MLITTLFYALLCPFSLAQEETAAFTGILDVRDFGAAGDGTTMDTKAIQAAVDACAAEGGGTVYLHNGTFLSGTVHLKSHVTLYLEAGATLLGSTDLSDYPMNVPSLRSYTDNYTEKSLIYAEKAENISILGRGTIDGQGASFKGPYKVRPYLLRIIECRDVMMKDITLRNSPMWVQHYLGCEDVTIDGITVHSKVNANNDGINIDGCRRVRIANADINSGDDAIVLKSTSDRPCQNVAVTNCVLTTFCNALKMGTESNAGFQNITIDNCTVYDTRLAGIALELVDGGALDRVNVSNIVMKNVECAIFIRLGNRARPFKEDMEKPGMGSMRNIMISDVQADGVGKTGCSITGLPGRPVENVTLDNIRIVFKGGGTLEDAALEVPEKETDYPEFSMFGKLPAYGFYTRHASNVRFRHLDLGFEEADARPALVFEDVQDLEIQGLDAHSLPATPELIRLKNVRGAFIHGCRPRTPPSSFLRLEDTDSREVVLTGNDLGK